ncbi:phosphate/phosphite/phosphonate ABC transporter substrate-binding protein [Vibrio japonicus]|uniref:Phosphate/phosphite/phosphonate ABC transporter substrate-binding protein n=1 Tax=Vibrio japonicus TaxID=1824638 RepID=A0ABY5LQP0_9VIBR|nr:phosphate/phosphite/phosphonate ABC transporter substrate-binding protein [Vibrio japonicus]UUM33034.1 phosphate/phosphite/phosphonate ABC transporter substrate-binding protein [Vibrio japonicus]
MLSGVGRTYALILSFILSFLLFVPSVSAAQPVKASSRENTLIIGVISHNPRKAFKRTQPFADYLAANLQQHKITSARVVVAKSIPQMKHWLNNGQVDLVSDTVFAASELTRDSGVHILARRWKSGVSEYSSVFFTKKNNQINSFDDLVGKTIVFEDRGSTSAFLIPVSILIEQGYKLYELTSPREQPPEGAIGYFFSDEFSKSGGESNMMSWVHRNIVASAAFSDSDWNKEIPEQIKNQLQIIYTSPPIPRSLMLARPDMPEKLQDDITQLLLTAHENEQGKHALTTYRKTKKFDAISSDVLASIEWAGQRKALIDAYMAR